MPILFCFEWNCSLSKEKKNASWWQDRIQYSTILRCNIFLVLLYGFQGNWKFLWKEMTKLNTEMALNIKLKACRKVLKNSTSADKYKFSTDFNSFFISFIGIFSICFQINMHCSPRENTLILYPKKKKKKIELGFLPATCKMAWTCT